jgi:hypothetical protein
VLKLLLDRYSDKVAHMTGGYFIATVLPVPADLGLMLAVVVGVGKELYVDDRPDWWDAAATIAGGVIGYLRFGWCQ